MSHVCGKSWGTTASGWTFCTLAPNHPGKCSCAGKDKPESVPYYHEQPEAAAEIAIRNERVTREENAR